MGGFSIWHLLIFAGILLLFFGAKRLPALGQSLAKTIKNFKDGLNNDPDNDNDNDNVKKDSSESPQELLNENKDVLKQVTKEKKSEHKS